MKTPHAAPCQQKADADGDQALIGAALSKVIRDAKQIRGIVARGAYAGWLQP